MYLFFDVLLKNRFAWKLKRLYRSHKLLVYIKGVFGLAHQVILRGPLQLLQPYCPCLASSAMFQSFLEGHVEYCDFLRKPAKYFGSFGSVNELI